MMRCFICEETFHESKKVVAQRGYYYVVCPHCTGGILMPRKKALNDLKKAYPEEYFDWKEAIGFRKYLNKIQLFVSYSEWIKSTYPKKPGSLLDVGAGFPGFALDMQRQGWNCFALEIASQQVKILRKYLGVSHVMKGDFEKYRLQKNSFNVLTFWHMLEHLSTPATSVRKAAQVLKKDGMLFAEFPNFDSLNLRIFREYYIHFDLPGHLVYYNKKSLINLFEKNGFTDITISYPLKLNASFSLILSKTIVSKSGSNFLAQLFFYLILPMSVILSVINSFLGQTDLIRISAHKK